MLLYFTAQQAAKGIKDVLKKSHNDCKFFNYIHLA